jgi:hypothetical protein
MQVKKRLISILSCLKQFLGRFFYTILFRIDHIGKKSKKLSAAVIHMHTKGRHITYLARIATCLEVKEIKIVRDSCLALFQSLYRMRSKTNKSIRVISGRKIPVENKKQDYLALFTPAGLKKLFIFSYDYFNLFETKSKLPARYLPFYMSRRFYEDKEEIFPPIDELVQKPRSITLGFAGAVNKRGYSQKAIFSLLDRYHIVEFMKTHFAKSLYISVDQKEKSDLYRSKRPFKFVITGKRGTRPSKYPLTPEEYIQFLAECDFFLALPGVSIPHAHNLIEAMRMGAVPIFNYNRYFHPQLKNGYNCFTYNTEAELIKILHTIPHLPKEKIAVMRDNVIKTYQTHFTSQTIAQLLEKNNTNAIQLLYICSSIETQSLKKKYNLP